MCGNKALLPGSSALSSCFKLPTVSSPSTCRSIGFKKALLHRTQPDLQSLSASIPPCAQRLHSLLRCCMETPDGELSLIHYFWKAGSVKIVQRKLFVQILRRLYLQRIFMSRRWLEKLFQVLNKCCRYDIIYQRLLDAKTRILRMWGRSLAKWYYPLTHSRVITRREAQRKSCQLCCIQTHRKTWKCGLPAFDPN